MDEVAGSLQPYGDHRFLLRFLSDVLARCRASPLTDDTSITALHPGGFVTRSVSTSWVCLDCMNSRKNFPKHPELYLQCLQSKLYDITSGLISQLHRVVLEEKYYTTGQVWLE